MDLPIICQKGPYKVEVKEGEKYSWCSCGLSQIQPFCDGAHKGKTEIYKSVKFIAPKTQIVEFCGCKHSKNGMFCDNQTCLNLA